MTTKTIRKVVTIDEEKCNGCGACVPSCAEGALKIIDGKARLISETYCDGLGACLGECPQGAITVEERVADEFDEAAVKLHLGERGETVTEEIPCGCPSAAVAQFARPDTGAVPGEAPPSRLANWPVQLTLVPPNAPFLQGTDLLLTADCVPFACAGFHQDFLRGHSLLVACPKLDNFAAHVQKLTDILRRSAVKSLTVVHMEVPCCSGLVYMAQQAIQTSGKSIPFKEVTIGIDGQMLSEA